VEGAVIVEKIKESAWEVGYNAMSDKFEDLLEAGALSRSLTYSTVLYCAQCIVRYSSVLHFPL